MNLEAIILMVVRALGSQGKKWLETGLCKVDEVVCNSDSELDNEIWLNILLPAIKEHKSLCPPPQP